MLSEKMKIKNKKIDKTIDKIEKFDIIKVQRNKKDFRKRGTLH